MDDINLSNGTGWYAIVKSVLILYANKQLLTFKENTSDAKQFRQEIDTDGCFCTELVAIEAEWKFSMLRKFCGNLFR
jgi:hypothetical protein